MEINTLVLLSDGLRDILEGVKQKHNCKIAEDLLEADSLIYSCVHLEQDKKWNCLYEGQYDTAIKIIKQSIGQRINNEARMLSFRYNTFEISYLPEGKEPVYADHGIWSRQNRQSAKPARIVQKLLTNKYSCRDFENFSNWLKAEMVCSGEFKVVEGKDISKYYLDKNYYKVDGTLGNSCMRYAECQPFFCIYEDNAKMLVLLKDEKVLGRAILWEIDGKTYMDRVYVCMDYLETNFIDYAEQNKWIHRETQALLTDGEYQWWLGPEANYKKAFQVDLSINLNVVYPYMPYLDTFRYYDKESNSIHTNPERGDITLSETEGEYINNYDEYSCARCGHSEDVHIGDAPETLSYSQYEDAWYCDDCCIYCEGIEDFICITTETVDVYIDRDETELYPLQYVKEHSDNFVEINEKWYSIPECSFIVPSTDGKYIIRDE